jgi:hypothetical protein
VVEYLKVFYHAGFFWLRRPRMIKLTRHEPMDKSNSTVAQHITEAASTYEHWLTREHFWEV